jgi:hypothetical protein
LPLLDPSIASQIVLRIRSFIWSLNCKHSDIMGWIMLFLCFLLHYELHPVE